MPIVKYKVMDVIIVYFSCLLNEVVTWLIQILLHITPPFSIAKHHIIKLLKLCSCIG